MPKEIHIILQIQDLTRILYEHAWNKNVSEIDLMTKWSNKLIQELMHLKEIRE